MDTPLLPNQFQPELYEALLKAKIESTKALLTPFVINEPDIFRSPVQEFRYRAEFRIWHEGTDLFYAMFDPENPKQPLRVDDYPFGSDDIRRLMPALRTALLSSEILRHRLFQVELLNTTTGECLVTLIYHRKLDELWYEKARSLETALNIKVIGRSRKQRVVVTGDTVRERLTVQDKVYEYTYFEQGFTQPNPAINVAMLNWVSSQVGHSGRDLLELYCGLGNFSIPLSRCFRRVLGTEVAKSSVKAAQANIAINHIDNLSIARLNASETAQAIRKERRFKRLDEISHEIDDYDFNTILVDPPRAGLDSDSTQLACSMDQIVYISCNPETLARDLDNLTKTHHVKKWAIFDQFPYTHHVECGVILNRRE